MSPFKARKRRYRRHRPPGRLRMCWAVLFSHGVIVLAYKHASSHQEVLSYARFSRLIAPTQKFWRAYQDIQRSWFTRIDTLLVKTPESRPDTTPET